MITVAAISAAAGIVCLLLAWPRLTLTFMAVALGALCMRFLP